MKIFRFHILVIVLFLMTKIAVPRNGLIMPEKSVLDSILTEYALNKDFDTAMLLPSLLAIQYYPELKDAHIEFRYRKIPTLMAARPRIWSCLGNADNRKYVIFISTNPKNRSHQIFNNMSLKSKTGIIGHEYAHLVDYQNRSGFGMLFFGINYLVNKRSIERDTDKITIERGLGNEMLEYNVHIKECRFASPKYLARKKKYYLSVAEIREMVDQTL